MTSDLKAQLRSLVIIDEVNSNNRLGEQAADTLDRRDAYIKKLEMALRQARKTMRNCQGAIESNQVDDKDVRRQLMRGHQAIDAALFHERPRP